MSVDAARNETARDYAAMILGVNWWISASTAEKKNVLAALRAAVKREGIATPDGILRFVRRLDLEFVRRAFKPPIEDAELLKALRRDPRAMTTQSLWAVYAGTPKVRKAIYYGRRYAIGQELIRRGDMRGVDILIRLLPKKAAPGQQARVNVFAIIERALGRDFEFDPGRR